MLIISHHLNLGMGKGNIEAILGYGERDKSACIAGLTIVLQNEEVINYVTIPNTLLNYQDEMASRCRFFSGDWDSFKEVIIGPVSQPSTKDNDSVESNSQLDEKSYDLILSSETIYNLDYFPKFLRTIKSCLRRDGGCLYLAAKTFYFGVGGGTRVFLNMVNEDDFLEGSVVHVIKPGVQREIIKVQCRSTS